MPPRKEPCRNFQRGYCQYGDRCKFLHVNQQQAKPNSFGFGTQNASQPQKPNPFGFGTQNTSTTQKPNPFGFGVQNNSKPNQFKPGDNKWSRFAPNSGNPSAPQKQDSQSSAPNHVCTDSESCKKQINEDFQQEKPLWILTCYGHRKYGPCDIIGDVSYEELRVSAYDDAKRGTNIQSIVEKERSLLKSKLIEFENLVRNPYTPPPDSNLNTQNTLSGTSTNIFPQMIQNNGPPSVSSFNQLGSTFNTGFQMRAPAPNNAFGQVNQFQAPTQTSNASQPNSFAFGNPSQMGNQPSTPSFVSPFPATATTFGNAFSTAATSPNLNKSSQQPSMSFGVQNPFPATTTPFGNAFSTTVPSPNLNKSSQQPSMSFGGQNPSANVGAESASSDRKAQNISDSNSNENNSIWFKDEWRAGEIPEEAPPEGVIF
ncbi:hypothetical protein SSX86_002975 [Deinandra increscens subsp. villosa]|uniref:C3H1-type domain-containing protein n=1 Tax=Deinandra increscens subsp. villosa TaxID=3103831 RepID=A0AAP0HBN2_9ASTR